MYVCLNDISIYVYIYMSVCVCIGFPPSFIFKNLLYIMEISINYIKQFIVQIVILMCVNIYV